MKQKILNIFENLDCDIVHKITSERLSGESPSPFVYFCQTFQLFTFFIYCNCLFEIEKCFR